MDPGQGSMWLTVIPDCQREKEKLQVCCNRGEDRVLGRTALGRGPKEAGSAQGDTSYRCWNKERFQCTACLGCVETVLPLTPIHHGSLALTLWKTHARRPVLSQFPWCWEATVGVDLLHQAESGESDWMSSKAWSCWRFGKSPKKGETGQCCSERVRITVKTCWLIFQPCHLLALYPWAPHSACPSLSSLCFKIGMTLSSEGCFHGSGRGHVQSPWHHAWPVVAADCMCPPWLPPSLPFLPSFLPPSLLPSLPPFLLSFLPSLPPSFLPSSAACSGSPVYQM